MEDHGGKNSYNYRHPRKATSASKNIQHGISYPRYAHADQTRQNRSAIPNKWANRTPAALSRQPDECSEGRPNDSGTVRTEFCQQRAKKRGMQRWQGMGGNITALLPSESTQSRLAMNLSGRTTTRFRSGPFASLMVERAMFRNASPKFSPYFLTEPYTPG